MNPLKTMPKPVKSLCARVGMERTRKAAWDAAKALRAEARAMLDAGRTDDEVLAWLQGELGAALTSQSRR